MSSAESSLTEKKIFIVGLPNSGKSQLFNSLTGDYSVVANYPLTTMEIKRSTCRLGDETLEIVDTPGIYRLYSHLREEGTVREVILSEKPDVLVQCIDAVRLKQSLALTADLLELGIPMTIAVNGLDAASRVGMRIDSRGLGRLLDIPVVEWKGLNGKGRGQLMEGIARARPGKWEVRYAESIEGGISALRALLPETLSFRRKMALLLLMNDVSILKYLQKSCPDADLGAVKEKAAEIRRQFLGNISLAVSRKRGQWVDEIAGQVAQGKTVSQAQLAVQVARFISTPITGIPILLLVVYVMYLLVANVANKVAEVLDGLLWQPVEHWIKTLLPAGFLHDLIIGPYGVLSLGIANALLTVLPVLTLFYLLFNILEDVGYIPNLSVMTKRLLEKFGLSGNAVMPLILGFGCKTMATLTTRTLQSRKERIITIYLIAFAIPCAAQTGINMSILGRAGLKAFIITFSVLALAEIAAGLALNKLIKSGARSEFIHELPVVRLPNMLQTLKKTYYRLIWFLKEAVPVFVYSALILFFLDRLGILAELRMLLRPFIQGALGLPLAMVDAIILCMGRREAAAGVIIQLIKSGELNYVQSIVAVIMTTMFVPCFANTMSMIRELGGKKALAMVGAINLSAFAVGGVVNWTLRAMLKA